MCAYWSRDTDNGNLMEENDMQGKYPIITLCGSTRFKDQFMEAQKRLTLEGNIVISVGLFGHSGEHGRGCSYQNKRDA